MVRKSTKIKKGDITAKEARTAIMRLLIKLDRDSRRTDMELHGLDSRKQKVVGPTLASRVTNEDIRRKWIRRAFINMGYRGKKLEYLIEVAEGVVEEIAKDIKYHRELKTGRTGIINAAYYLAKFEKNGKNPIAMHIVGETINARRRYGRAIKANEKEKAKKVVQDTKEAMEKFLTTRDSKEKMKAFKQLKKLMGLDKTFSKLNAFEILARETFMKEYAKRIGVRIGIRADGVYDTSDMVAAYRLQSATKRGKGNLLKKRFYSLEKDGMFGAQSVYTALINMDLELSGTYDSNIWKPKDLEKYIVDQIKSPITFRKISEADMKEFDERLKRDLEAHMKEIEKELELKHKDILKSKPRKK